MADNLTTQSTTPATVPASTQIATDEVASVHYQRVKLVDGTADSTTGIPGDASNGLDVDVTRVQGTVAVSGPLTDTQLRATAVPVSGTFWQATQPVSGSVSVSNLPATQSVSGTVGVSGTVTVDGSGVTQPVSGPLTDTQLRATPVPVSWSGQTVSLAANTKVTQTPATSGGLSYARVATAASSNNASCLQAGNTQLYGIVAGNANASPRYIHIYDTGSTPTVGTTTLKMTFLIPGNTAGAGLVMSFDSGIAFSSGLGVAITTELTGAAGNTTTGADAVVNFLYK